MFSNPLYLSTRCSKSPRELVESVFSLTFDDMEFLLSRLRLTKLGKLKKNFFVFVYINTRSVINYDLLWKTRISALLLLRLCNPTTKALVNLIVFDVSLYVL